jgi:hypothetical protein
MESGVFWTAPALSTITQKEVPTKFVDFRNALGHGRRNELEERGDRRLPRLCRVPLGALRPEVGRRRALALCVRARRLPRRRGREANGAGDPLSRSSAPDRSSWLLLEP